MIIIDTLKEAFCVLNAIVDVKGWLLNGLFVCFIIIFLGVFGIFCGFPSEKMNYLCRFIIVLTLFAMFFLNLR